MIIYAAVIGTGIGLKHVEAINNYKGSKVLYICEKNKNKIPKLKKIFPGVEILNNEKKIFEDKKINLISIASYDNFHFSQIIKSIKNKKNIIVEKPLCLRESQLHIIMQKLRKEKKISITSNLPLRVNSLFKKIKKNINKKNIYYIEADYIWGRREKIFQWRSQIKDYTVTLGAAIHMIDLVMWMLDEKPISVSAYGNKVVTKNSKFLKESFLVYIMRFPNNIIVKITANAASIYNHFHELKIFEKNKTIVHGFSDTFSFIKNKKKTRYVKIKSNYPDKSNRKNLIHNFIDTIQNKNVKPVINLKEQVNLMSVCFAADKSLKSRKEIKIKYL